MIEFLNFYLIPGLVLGSVYALGAVGVTLTFGILRFANFAHGETMTLGAFIALSLASFSGWHPFAVLPFAMALTAAAVLGMDRLFFRPVAPSLDDHPRHFLLRLMLMVRSLVQLIWGAKLRSFSQGIEIPLGDLRLVAHLSQACRHRLCRHRADAGRASAARANAGRKGDARHGRFTRPCPPPPESTRSGLFSPPGSWAAGWRRAAGVFLAYDTHVESQLGFKLLLPIFAAALLGGIGRPYGAMAGGLVIGLIEELSTYPWIGSRPGVARLQDRHCLRDHGCTADLATERLFRGRVFQS